MQLFAILLSAVFAAPAVLATPTPASTTATWSQLYDNSGDSLNGVACSNGPNGLITKGFTTLGSLPSFPYIGGSHFVSGWNSPNCGSCWSVGFEGKTITVLAIDTSGPGFILSEEAFQDLTNDQGVAKGTVDVTYEQIDASNCGL